MKKAPSYLTVALVIGALLAGNLLALFLFREQAKFIAPSLIPTVTAATVTLWGVLAVLFRHKCNCLAFRRHAVLLALLREDDPRT